MFPGPALDSDTLLMIWWTQGWLMSSNLKFLYSHLCLLYGIYGILCLVHSFLVSLAAHDLPMQQFFYQNQRAYEVNKNNIYTFFPLPASDESTNLSKPSKWDCRIIESCRSVKIPLKQLAESLCSSVVVSIRMVEVLRWQRPMATQLE